MERSQDNFYWSQMLKHLAEQYVVWFQTRNSEKYLRGRWWNRSSPSSMAAT